MKIETDRLLIHTCTETHSGFLATILTNEDVNKHNGGVAAPFDETIKKIKKNPDILSRFNVIIIKENNSLAGIVLFIKNDHFGEEEILILLMPEFWDKGYGREAFSAAREWWMMENKQNYMFATAEIKNGRSIAMLESEGFKFIEEYEDGRHHSSRKRVYKYTKKHNNIRID